MFSDVPADGYSVELGQREPPETRGQILATGQLVRFSFCVLAGIIQSVLLNGPTTNAAGTPIDFDHAWSFGLTVNHYYGLLFCLIAVLAAPLVFLKELPPREGADAGHHGFAHHGREIWEIMKNRTNLNILIFVIGSSTLMGLTNIANIYLQYYLIELTNFEVSALATMLARCPK